MSGCYPETLSFCVHLRPVKFGCPVCDLNKIMNKTSMEIFMENQDKNVSPIIQQMQELEKRIKDIEYRLDHIVELPTEIDVRLQDIERIIDKIPDNYKRHDLELENRIKELEDWTRADEDRIYARIKAIEKTISELVDKIAEIANHAYAEKKPHKCPVCEGRRNIVGEIPNGTYFEFPCKSCEGKGIIWG